MTDVVVVVVVVVVIAASLKAVPIANAMGGKRSSASSSSTSSSSLSSMTTAMMSSSSSSFDVHYSRPPHDTRLYDLLGVAHDATSDEISRCYRRRSREFHPDKWRVVASSGPISRSSPPTTPSSPGGSSDRDGVEDVAMADVRRWYFGS